MDNEKGTDKDQSQGWNGYSNMEPSSNSADIDADENRISLV
jgi:hypothetical protein